MSLSTYSTFAPHRHSTAIAPKRAARTEAKRGGLFGAENAN